MHNVQLTLATTNPKVRAAEYAVRGAVLDRAMELQAELESGSSTLPFDKVVKCNIGNPQALGQKPLTFVRQVLCLCMNPELLKTKKGSGWAPPDVVERAKAYLAAIPSTGVYTHSQGVRIVRDEVAAATERRDGFPCDASDLFLTEGASAGVKIAIDMLLRNKQDAILTPIPQYPLYSAAIALRGGTLAPYNLDESAAWGVNIATLRESLRRSRRAGNEVRGMVVINPGNPTGQTLEEGAMRDVLQLCADERLVLMADEVYQRNVYTAGKEFVSFKRVLRLMEQEGVLEEGSVQLISFHSISKGFTGECGLRGGYFELVGFSAAVKAEMLKLASIGLCSGVPGQLVVGLTSNPPVEGDASFAKYEKESTAILSSLRARQIKIVDALRKLEGVTCNDADGAMYAFPQLTIPPHGFDAAKARGCAPDALYALELVEHTGIVVVPGSGFRQAEGTHHIRITILPPPGELPGVLKRLTTFHAAFMKGTTHGIADAAVAKALVAGGAGEKKSGPSKFMKMLTRTVIAFSLFAIFFGIMKAGHQWMILTVLLIQVELFREFTNVRCVQRVSFARAHAPVAAAHPSDCCPPFASPRLIFNLEGTTADSRCRSLSSAASFTAASARRSLRCRAKRASLP
jgi:alanine transaminase